MDSNQILKSLIASAPLAFAAMMPVINPVGTSLILLGLTPAADEKTRHQLARKIAINTFVLSVVFLLIGHYVLTFFGISVPIIQFAGGFIVMSMGLSMLNESESKKLDSENIESAKKQSEYFEKSFFPFTFPLTIGPGGVAVAITLSAHTSSGDYMERIANLSGSIAGILAMTVVTFFCLAYAHRLVDRIGANGVSALSRLMSFLVVCIGAEICWTGVKALIMQLK